MRKILVIARREYMAMVAAKSFLISLAMMPVLMLGGILVPRLLEGHVDLEDRVVVVLDHSGKLFETLQKRAEERNQQKAIDPKTKEQKSAKYVIKAGRTPVDDAYRLELSNQIRDQKIYAFIEVPANILDEVDEIHKAPIVWFYSANSAFSDLKRWLQTTLLTEVQVNRLSAKNVTQKDIQLAMAVPVLTKGLYKESKAGKISAEATKSDIVAILTPLITMMMMFMVVMMSVQPMLESVLEEKSMRIAEVLLGSVNPFQLMAGKLMGNVMASLTIVAVYLTGGFIIAVVNDVTHLIPFGLLPWFIVFQILAVFLYGAIFLAIGAAVSHLKEAQGYLLPVWLMMTLPMALWFNIAREPTGSFATTMSFIPPFTPMLMSLRLGASQVIPIWQPIVGLLVLILTTIAVLFMAGRIFRIGILSQGKTPKLGELLRWAIRG